MNSIDNLREWWRDRFPVMDRQLGCDFREHIDAIEQEHKQTLHDAVNKAHADGERNALRQERSASEDYRRGLEDGRTEGYALAHTTTKQEADAYAEMESFHDRLCRASERREDVTLWGVDYTPLPVDADGEPIHVGDVMELAGGDVEKVESLHNYGSEGWSVTTTHNAAVIPWSTRHHHAPTVEDVLREFAGDIADVLGGDDFRLDGNDELIAEYAAKLRLAGDE